jgi:high-affinity Fe2+/Pb2+ permease
MFKKCEHLGWKRLSILIGLFCALSSSIFIISTSRAQVQTIFEVLISFVIAFFAGMLIVIGTRNIILWVHDGFKSPR